MKRCSYKNCQNMCQDVSKISYFLLPNDSRRSAWLVNSGNENLLTNNGRSKRFLYICEKHFDEKYLLRSGQRIQLSKSAVPKVFIAQHTISRSNIIDHQMDELMMAKDIVSTDEFLNAEEFLGSYGY